MRPIRRGVPPGNLHSWGSTEGNPSQSEVLILVAEEGQSEFANAQRSRESGERHMEGDLGKDVVVNVREAFNAMVMTRNWSKDILLMERENAYTGSGHLGS